MGRPQNRWHPCPSVPLQPKDHLRGCVCYFSRRNLMSEVHADSNERPRCVVMKFGGTSVEDAAAIRRLCQILNGRLRYHPVVVVSALAKVTDQLFGAGNAAARCDHENACTILQEIEGRHSMLSRELLAAEEGNALCQDLATDFRATYELHATRIEIWTDVDGVMTTDPNLCSEARCVGRMSFDEAAELAYFGAKVLHPSSLLPARRQDIPVWVLNSRNPEGAGTEISAHSHDDGRIKALSVKRGVAVVDVEPVRWLAPELLREVCEVFENHQHTLDLLSASRGSLSLLVTSTAALPAIAEELKGLASVRWENHKALVCLVGEKIRRRPEIASKVFRAISDIDMRMICQGASERSIGFLVDESRAEESIKRLHKVFFSSESTPEPRASNYALCQSGGTWQ